MRSWGKHGARARRGLWPPVAMRAEWGSKGCNCTHGDGSVGGKALEPKWLRRVLLGCCVGAAWVLLGCCLGAAWVLRGCCLRAA
eukprot:6763444-Lingulodinium_polyedra.AAC.1